MEFFLPKEMTDINNSKAIPLEHREHILYRIFCEAGCLLYVGMTNDLKTRLINHNCHWPEQCPMVFLCAEIYPDRISARTAETAAIRAELPRFNVRKHPAHERAELADSTTGRRDEQIRVTRISFGSPCHGEGSQWAWTERGRWKITKPVVAIRSPLVHSNIPS